MWSAPDALDHGLIDEIGDLEDAVKLAADLAGIENYQMNLFEEELSPFDELMSEFGQSIVVKVAGVSEDLRYPSAATRLAGEFLETLEPLQTMNDPNHIYAICELCEVQ